MKSTPASNEILTLRKQLQQLQQLRDAGSLGEQAYADARTPLERKLVDLVLTNPQAAAAPEAPAAPATPRPSVRLVAVLCIGVLALAVGGYSWTGSPGATQVAEAQPQPVGSEAGGADEQQFIAAVEQLAQRLKEQPENAEGWAMLARSYARLGRHSDAVPAYVKAVALRGDDPRLLVDYADTLAVQSNRTLEGEPLKLIERALQLDPKNAKGLALAGTAAFDRRDFKTAVGHWELLASVLPSDSDFMPQLQASIAQAREQAGLPKADPPPRVAATPAAGTAATAAATPLQAVAGARIQGTVRLSPALAAQASPTDTVFIFARAAEGPRMPLAILRHQVKDLPISFTLDDTSAMSPAMRLSLHPQVVVSARISKSGQAVPAPGDLTGQSASIANIASGLVIEIGEVVGN